MPTPGLESLEQLKQVTSNKKGQVGGYKFQNDSLTNQMAFLFGSAEGEKKAKRIREEADERFPSPVQIPEKKKFIAAKVKELAQEADNKVTEEFHKLDFKQFKENSKTEEGRKANDAMAVQMMRAIGLNVDPDNVTTKYSEPPPTISVCFIIRPTKNLAKEDSEINQLANSYAACCPKDERAQFETDWGARRTQAREGGPKMAREEFLAMANKQFEERTQATPSRLSTLSPLPNVATHEPPRFTS